MSKRKALFTRTPRFRPQSCTATAAAEAECFSRLGGGCEFRVWELRLWEDWDIGWLYGASGLRFGV